MEIWTTCLLRPVASCFFVLMVVVDRLVPGVRVVDDIDVTGKRQVDSIGNHCKSVLSWCLCRLVGHNPHGDRA